MAEPKRITISEIASLLDRGEPVLFIDTRNPKAWAEANTMIKGAVRIHFEDLEKHLNELPRDRTIVTYCT